MSVANLEFLFKPRSIALFGADKAARTIGSIVADNLFRSGFDGPVMPVHPSDPAVRGVLAYPSIDDLPMPPDLAVIALPPAQVPPLIGQLGARGTRAAVVLTPDFDANGPEEGAQLRARMLAAAKPYLMRIVGPACLGIVVPREGVNASWAQAAALDGDLAFVSQSGSLMTSMVDWAAARGVGFSLLASLGDMADVDFGDLLDHLALDPETRAVLLCVDHIVHPRKFLSAARAAARLKPVIIFDAGRHGAAGTGDQRSSVRVERSEAYDAAFRRAGLLPVPTLADLVAAAGTVATGIRLPSGRLAVLSNGRGIGEVAGNLVLEEGGQLAELSAKTIEELDRLLPHTWGRRNPINLFADATAARWRDAIGPILADPGVDAIVAINAPTAIGDTLEAARSVAELLRRERKPVAAVWMEERTREESRRLFAGRRVSVHGEPGQAIEALMQLVHWHRSQEMLMQTPATLPDLFANDAAAARAIVRHALAEGRSSLTEDEAKQLLTAYAMPVSDTGCAATAEEVLGLAAAIGFPVTLRIRGALARDIGVVGGGAIVDLRTSSEIETAAKRLMRWYQNSQPNSPFPGFTVSRSVDASRQYELRIGLTVDSSFGPMVLFGRGGAIARIYPDQSVALPPLNLNLARRMIEDTRVCRLLQEGYGERPPANLDEIAEALVRVSQIACEIAEIVEIEIDPLLADRDGVLAVEMSVRIAPADRPAEERLAIRPYPTALEQSVTSRAGKPLRIRPIRPEDEPALQAFVLAQSPQDRRLRFFSHVKELDHRMAARLTQIDYDREMALVLIDPAAAETEILGVMRISADADGSRAEYAGAVRSDLKGEGFGRLLLEEIIAYAAKRGIGEVWGEVLAENTPMLSLVRKLGFTVKKSPEDPSLMIVVKPLSRT